MPSEDIPRIYDALIACYALAQKPIPLDRVHAALEKVVPEFPNELGCLQSEKFEGLNKQPRYSIIYKLSVEATRSGILTEASQIQNRESHKHIRRLPEVSYSKDHLHIAQRIFNLAQQAA